MNYSQVLGVKINNITKNESINLIDSFIVSKKPHQICTVNPEFLVLAQKDDNFRDVLNSSDLNVADGSGILWASSILKNGKIIKERVTGIDLIYKICELAIEKSYSLYLLGSENNMFVKTRENLLKLYPKLCIKNSEEGITRSQKNNQKIINELITRINKAKPDILLVAFGFPFQDKFINKYKAQLNVPVMIGVGGSFDFIAGKVKRAPKFVQALWLEWLWRLILEPSRFRRIFNAVIVFNYLVVKEKFKS